MDYTLEQIDAACNKANMAVYELASIMASLGSASRKPETIQVGDSLFAVHKELAALTRQIEMKNNTVRRQKPQGVPMNKQQAQAWVARNCAFAKKNDKTVSEDKFKRCKEEVKENSPGVNEYAVCTDSMGGQPASYHKKKGEDKK